jgi:hypothetical protein
MVGGNFDKDDPDAIGVLDPHLGQAPRLCGRLPENAGPCRGEAAVLGRIRLLRISTLRSSQPVPVNVPLLIVTLPLTRTSLTPAES